MEYRKLIKFGESSHVVSLPTAWIRAHGLKKGDLIYLEENGNKELVLTAGAERERIDARKDIIINLNNKDIALVKREIVSAYLNGISKITVTGTNFNKHRKTIRDLTNILMALEIIEEGSDRMVLKDFLNFDDIEIKDTG